MTTQPHWVDRKFPSLLPCSFPRGPKLAVDPVIHASRPHATMPANPPSLFFLLLWQISSVPMNALNDPCMYVYTASNSHTPC